MIYIDEATETSQEVRKEIIDEYKVFCVNNVESYEHKCYKAWEITMFNSFIIDEKDPPTSIYFVGDTIYGDAFAHWVYETAIYLPLFKKMKLIHPTLKLYLKSHKTFKLLFCSYFGIDLDDIVYTFVPGVRCYFPSPISALNDPQLHPEYVTHLDIFWDYFKCTDVINKYSVNVFPRQKKENYTVNDRNVPFNLIIQYTDRIPNHTITETDNITDLNTQLEKIRSSNIIVLSDGSPFLVNGMLCYNKHIIISGQSCTEAQGVTYYKIAYIIKKIREQNISLSYIDSQHNTCIKITELMLKTNIYSA
jgi:hypothetical protein